jgi:predicted transcriptional regulator
VRHRRSRYDIYEEILGSAIKGVYPTRMMYRCKLSFDQLKQFILELLEFGLLSAEDSKGKASGRTNVLGKHVLYRTTDKGIEYLKKFKELKILLRAEDEDFPIILINRKL